MIFIQITFSSHSTLVLSVRKKDGLLYLYVDFYSLNYITKKDYYLLLLISNLLDLLYKVSQTSFSLYFHNQ